MHRPLSRLLSCVVLSLPGVATLCDAQQARAGDAIPAAAPASPPAPSGPEAIAATAIPATAIGVQAVSLDQAPGEHLYHDVPAWRSAPSAAAEFGMGTVIPSLRTPAEMLLARLGIAIETPTSWTIVLAGQTGVTMAFNTGGSTPFYGYLLRVPFQLFGEAIWSQLMEYKGRRYLNFHLGLGGGPEFMLSAQCQSGSCGYVTPNVYYGVGVRAGLSYSAQVRSSVGLFVTWQNDFAGCANGSNCDYNWLSTLTWSLGWTLF
jgi:hypothetical protein